jgi:cysteine desulfurase
MIYLDYAATTPLAPSVLEAMLPFLRGDGLHANPASTHGPGFRARKAVETARAQVAALIGAEPGEIIWTSGATESNNLAIKGALEFRAGSNANAHSFRGAHIVTSKTEHKCVLDTCRHLETLGARVTTLKPGADGRVTPQQVLEAITPETALVSLMWVNNEIGVVQDIETLAPLLRDRGVMFHVDAAQAAGKLPIDLRQVPVDLLSLSAHKIYGPKGIGALFVRRKPRARLAPQIHGGGHEQGMRSGTLAPHQCVGMGAAFALAAECMVDDAERLSALREQLWSGLQRLPRIHRNGLPLADGGGLSPHVLNVSFEGVEGESLRASLPQIAVSSGSACSSATAEPSYVLRALGRDDELANASLRFSFGRDTRAADIDAVTASVIEQVSWLRELSPLYSAGAAQ